MQYDSIIAVVDRSVQGATLPFKCILESDQSEVYVKGDYAGYDTCIAEIVSYEIAKILELPIPEARIVTLPSAIEQQTLRDDINELGQGDWFGSIIIPWTSNIQYPQIKSIPLELRKKILLFDIWICNGDRQLGKNDGNPNILYSSNGVFHVMDHNLAFGNDSLEYFKKEHIFADLFESLRDKEFQESIRPLMLEAYEKLDEIWEYLPDEWVEKGLITLSKISSILGRINDESFWRF